MGSSIVSETLLCSGCDRTKARAAFSSSQNKARLPRCKDCLSIGAPRGTDPASRNFGGPDRLRRQLRGWKLVLTVVAITYFAVFHVNPGDPTDPTATQSASDPWVSQAALNGHTGTLKILYYVLGMAVSVCLPSTV